MSLNCRCGILFLSQNSLVVNPCTESNYNIANLTKSQLNKAPKLYIYSPKINESEFKKKKNFDVIIQRQYIKISQTLPDYIAQNFQKGLIKHNNSLW